MESSEHVPTKSETTMETVKKNFVVYKHLLVLFLSACEIKIESYEVNTSGNKSL